MWEYPIRTERLELRPATEDDAEAMARYRGQAEVTRYVPFEPQSPADVVVSLRRPHWVHELTDAGQAVLLVALAGGHVVGDVMLSWTSKEHGTGEIGYVLDPAVQGRGYATEAAGALLPLAFSRLGLHRVVARVDARNGASARVLLRLGFRQEAHLVENEWFKGEWTDELDFALLAREWAAPRRSSPAHG